MIPATCYPLPQYPIYILEKYIISIIRNIKKYQNIESKVKKLGGKAKRGWTGIKLINDDSDDDDDEPKSGLDAK